MKRKITFSILIALLLLAATTVIAWAWPDQPPDKVLISGPGIEGQVQVKGDQDRALFQLGHLEDLKSVASPPAEVTQGFQIVRYFYGGEFDFARLTYYPGPNGSRGVLYWEDGPMLEGDHTPYHQTWLFPTPNGEQQLRGLLLRLGAQLDSNGPAAAPAVQDKPVEGNSSSNAAVPTDSASWVVPVIAALLVGAIGVFSVGRLIERWRQNSRSA